MRPNIALVPLLCALFMLAACSKEPDIIYGVNDVNIGRPDAPKQYVKSQTEFISIAYTDLFGSNISQQELLDMGKAYDSFGDLKLIEDMIIRNFLNRPGVDIPTDAAMRADIGAFVSASYQKFYNRHPNEFEIWYMTELIQDDAALSPEIFYYAMMTSNEYRYY
jgi:hypothetical protein